MGREFLISGTNVSLPTVNCYIRYIVHTVPVFLRLQDVENWQFSTAPFGPEKTGETHVVQHLYTFNPLPLAVY